MCVVASIVVASIAHLGSSLPTPSLAEKPLTADTACDRRLTHARTPYHLHQEPAVGPQKQNDRGCFMAQALCCPPNEDGDSLPYEAARMTSAPIRDPCLPCLCHCTSTSPAQRRSHQTGHSSTPTVTSTRDTMLASITRCCRNAVVDRR